MTDFARILEDWENRAGRRDREPADKDREAEAVQPVVTRAEMERARAEDSLDLHGMTQAEAVTALRTYLRESSQGGLKKVLVIHGKGLHSEQRQGVLKEAVAQVLVKDRHVAAWGEAGRKEGGRGASWVWLSVRGK